MRDGTIYRRSAGPVSVQAALRLAKDSATVTIGQDRNRTTTSAYNRHTGGMVLMRHFVLTQILWDIYAAGTYKVAFVDGLGASPADLYVVNAAYSAAGGSAEETIGAHPNILLTPGQYYLSLLNTTKVKYDDRNTVMVEVNSYFWLRNASLDGGATGKYSLPIKLVGHVATVSGAAPFLPVMC